MVVFIGPHDKSSLGNRWKVAEQKIGEFLACGHVK
jgi:hypothetical protein